MSRYLDLFLYLLWILVLGGHAACSFDYENNLAHYLLCIANRCTHMSAPSVSRGGERSRTRPRRHHAPESDRGPTVCGMTTFHPKVC